MEEEGEEHPLKPTLPLPAITNMVIVHIEAELDRRSRWSRSIQSCALVGI